MSEEQNTPGTRTEDEDLYVQQSIRVDPKQTPLRIDKFLLDKLLRVSRHKIQNGIRAGSVTVDNKQVKPNFKVKPGQLINVVFPKLLEDSKGAQAEDIPLDIRYEDDDLMIIYKPPGMVVHPGVGNRTGTLVNAVLYHLKNIEVPVLAGNDQSRAGIVHRLDKDTSGLLVVAKTDFAMTHLAKQFFNHTVERTYNAIVWSSFDDTEGVIEGHIGRHPRDRRIRTVFPEGEEGKHAITHYKVLEDLYYITLVECRLETGRTHQIRVHMKHMGNPVFSDSSYGGDSIRKGTVFSKYKQFVHNCFQILPRQGLHAKTLGFIHPTTGEKMEFEAPLPDDMSQVLDRWRNYLASRKNHE